MIFKLNEQDLRVMKFAQLEFKTMVKRISNECYCN